MKLLPLTLSLVACLLFSSFTQAQEPPKERQCPKPSATKAPATTPTFPGLSVLELAVSIGQAELKTIQKQQEHLDDIEYYKKWEAFDVATNKPIKLKDLKDKQLRGFFLYQAEQLHTKLLLDVDVWKAFAAKLNSTQVAKDDPHKEAKEKAYQEISATFLRLVSDVQKLHGKLAEKREQMIDDMIKEYEEKDKELAKEMRSYLEDVRKEHDRLRLIVRTKGN